MKEQEQTVKITLEEYKRLLLKETNKNEINNRLAEMLLISVRRHLKNGKPNSWDSTYVGDGMIVASADDGIEFRDLYKELVKEAMRTIKIVDFDLYMEIWNEVQTNERKKTEMEMKIEQMNKAKELRQKNKEQDEQHN